MLIPEFSFMHNQIRIKNSIMKLLEIEGVKMECGAPLPLVFADEHRVQLIFLKLVESDVIPENDLKTVDIYVLTFNRCLKHCFGFPSDEALYGHPYHSLGMESYAFYELENSDWLAELEKIEKKAFPDYDVTKHWTIYKHYIITFHDSMFECIAKDYSIEERTIPSNVYVKLGKIEGFFME